MKYVLRSGALTVAVGAGLSLAVLPTGSASAAEDIQVRCNDIPGLVAAINQANTNGGRITLAPRCTYTLTTPDNPDDGLPEITGDVTISGKDSTIRRDPDATEDFRIFHVVSGGTLTLKSLTVRGGSIENMGGGALNDQGTLNLNNTVVKDNLATTGGGLYNDGGQLNLDRSTVERNSAVGFGGGVVNDGGGTMTMKRGALLKNRAALNNGGGLENILGTATLESVSVRGNTAVSGGGIRNVNGSTLNLKSTTLKENIAVSGGGLSNVASPATLVDSLVTRNTAITSGGGIDNQSNGQVTLTNTKVIDNEPDNCSPEGSVPGCTNPTATIDPPSTQDLLPDDDIKDPQ
ncbi:right-handed parallel beta-helix repeat-containing protein [Streptomyces melanosporofaciens]|uniref:right-handed parallel beta-helix repeat-containing protein n=1 Tax=unclassified Streptomyces TaxID=2593676 RepID=UPI00367DFE51